MPARARRLVLGVIAVLWLQPATTGWSQSCIADCDGDGAVTVDEIVTVVNIALGNRPLIDCPAGDSSNDGTITVDEIVAALNFALDGCPQPTPTPTASPSPVSDAVRIDLGSTSGSPGGVVRIAVTLSDNQDVVVATSNDITYDRTQVRVVATEPVSCAINSAIGPGTAANKMILANLLPSAGPSETLRVGVFAINTNVIPEGIMFTCDFQIAPTASAGDKVLLNDPDSSRADGIAPDTIGDNGVITVTP